MVAERLLRLRDACVSAGGRGQGSPAPRPGDLRRHGAAELVEHRVHGHA